MTTIDDSQSQEPSRPNDTDGPTHKSTPEAPQDASSSASAAIHRTTAKDEGKDKRDVKKPVEAEGKKLDALLSQRINRAANQDYLRVLGMVGGSLPMAAGSDISAMHGDGSSHYNLGGVNSFTGFAFDDNDGVISPSQRSTDVSDRERLRVRSVYVQHDGFQMCLNRLKQTHCVALRGLAGLGKRAMAIALANELSVVNGNTSNLVIRELGSGGDWAVEVKASDVPPYSCFLVDGVLRRTGQLFKAEQANALLRLLVEKQCYLVFCAQTDVPFPREIRVTMVEPLLVKQSEKVLLNHLQHYNIANSDEVMQHDTITKILKQGLPLAQADHLAAAIADGLAEKCTLNECLAQFEENTSELARDWIEEAANEGVAELSFRLALASFSGVSYSGIRHIADVLQKELQPEDPKPKDEKSEPTSKPFVVSRSSAQLERAQAWRRKREIPTEYSDKTTIEVLELKNERMCEPALVYAWREFDLGDPLLRWLRYFAVNGERDVRTRASVMIGALAATDFHEICNNILQPWAQIEVRDEAERERHHEAIGNALSVLTAKGVLENDVISLLNHWANSESMLLRCAAARAFSRVALWRPQDALPVWRKIVESVGKISMALEAAHMGHYQWRIVMPHPLHVAVVESVMNFFHCAAEYPYRLRPIMERALEGLKQWVDADTKDRKAEQVGLLLFAMLMMVKEPLEDNGGDPNDWPPALLQIARAQTDEKYRTIVCELLSRAMDRRDVGFGVADTLCNWIASAEKSGHRDAIRTLLEALVNLPSYSKRERDRLRMYLMSWAQHPTQPLLLAEELLQDLGWA